MSREYSPDDAADALQYCDPGQPRREWVRLLAAAKDAGLSLDEVTTWSASAPNFSGNASVAAAWRSISAAGAVKAGTLFHEARAAGWKPRRADDPPRPARVAPAIPPAAVEPLRPKHVTLSEYGRDIWSDARPLAGTIGEQYLKARRCVLPPADGDLRFIAAPPYPKLGATPEERAAQPDFTGPALVALVTDIATGEPIGLHRTWICADGTKANTPGPARLLLGGHRKQGGVIRLWPDEAVTSGLALCEGIETALSLAHAFRPVWSAIDAGNMAGLPVLDGIECLTIGADNDAAGIAAAQKLGRRWADAGRTVSIVRPARAGLDLNDVIARGVAA